MKKIINVHNASSWFLESLTGRSHKSAPNSCMLSRSNQYLEGCLSWFSKQIVHLLFCVFQTKLNKAVNIFVDYQNGSEMYKWYQVLVQDLDENVD